MASDRLDDICDACGHQRRWHTEGGMCQGTRAGIECHCVMPRSQVESVPKRNAEAPPVDAASSVGAHNALAVPRSGGIPQDILEAADLPWRIITNYPMFVGQGIAVQNAKEIAHQERHPEEIFGLYIGRAHDKALVARWTAVVNLVNRFAALPSASGAAEAERK